MANLVVCPVCSKKFLQGQKTQVYCSNSCANRIKVLVRTAKQQREMIEGRNCRYCNKHFMPTTIKQAYCSERCQEKKQVSVNAYNERLKKPAETKPQPYIVQPRRIIETDADQARLKKQIDEKHGVCNGPVIIHKKGTPEWNEIVKTLTPPHKIKNVNALHGSKTAKNIHFQGAYL